jgi:aminoglycoside 3-N-acetyltransferase
MISSEYHTDVLQKIKNELAYSWNKSGIETGDTVLLHSSLSRFLKKYKSKEIQVSPKDILESFLIASGEKGTLIFPTYNFDFTKGITFDICNTRSETGVLSEAARLHPDSVRTGHPLFSFAVIGYHKNIFENLCNFSAFGKDSPFAKLLELEGKIAALDVAGEFCMTFYHHVEEMENAPNRFHKVFRGNYIDKYGVQSEKEFNVYSRKTEEGVETDVKPMEEYLWSKGLYSGYRPGEGSCLHVIKADRVYDEASAIIKEGKSLGMLYKTGKNN